MDYCTWWPDLWYGECCASHDVRARDTTYQWLKANAWLAYCVWSASYSTKNCDTVLKVIWGRYLAPVLMFTGTSTLGWYWRYKALQRIK